MVEEKTDGHQSEGKYAEVGEAPVEVEEKTDLEILIRGKQIVAIQNRIYAVHYTSFKIVYV